MSQGPEKIQTYAAFVLITPESRSLGFPAAEYRRAGHTLEETHQIFKVSRISLGTMTLTDGLSWIIMYAV